MTGAQFVNAVALGQVTPGPVVHTVAVVGYAAAGIGGALLAAAIAFTPSFVFVLAGARHFDALRSNARVQAFLQGAGAAAIGGIAGSAIALGRTLSEPWQVLVLALSGLGLWVLPRRSATVSVLLLAGFTGAVVALLGAPLPS
jgi:chromate transporter